MRILAAALLAAVALTLAAPAAFAFDIWVTRYDDPVPDGCTPSDCSLREAVIAAKVSLVPDRIFLSAGTYELTRAGAGEDESLTGDLDIIDQDLEIVGAGANLTTIDANGLDRVLDIGREIIQSELEVRIAEVTLRGGRMTTLGSAIWVRAVSLEIEGCELTGNEDPEGGEDPTIRANQFASLTVRSSTVAGNAAAGLTVIQASASLINTTFSLNSGRELEVAGDGTLLCNHCTIGGSTAASEVGALDGLVQLLNSIVIGECFEDSEGTLQTLGGNLEVPGATCGLGGSDQDDVASSGLGSLDWNGGATRTRFPSLSSPAVSGAVDAFCAESDQRGAERSGTNCETGAVERATARPDIPIFHDGFDQGDEEAWSDVEG